ncbi:MULTISPECIES: FAD-dependent oxidoreductase [Rhodococcus]|uniref:FAD-dependent oxidoreductase n=1 Tax=Rhodococcus TaxID=1827 RepID=UPI0013520B8C|nr:MULTISPECIES: FAD-dependent oxidoreductase [Rhodococcus]WAL46317.1 FAD-dependent oxidoreductase [Rhodococcus pyridinivorans]
MRNRLIDDAATHPWQEVFDVVVVGSGAAGLVAATMAADGGASVLLLEKSARLGGTTALSGGAAWIPANGHVGELGGTDSRADALAYIKALAGDDVPDPELIDVFVDTAPQMLDYLEQHTPLKMAAIPGFPDYYLHLEEIPGRTSGGRAVEALPFPVRDELPDHADALPVRSTLNILGERTTHAEERTRQDPDELAAEIARRTAADVRVKGVALVARLLRGLLDRGVVVRASSPVDGLIIAGDDVVGVRSCGVDLGARQAVVLASGGFEWDSESVRGFIGYDVVPVSASTNTGDGLKMVLEAGASVANMRSYFGTVVAYDPALTEAGEPVAQAGLPIRTHAASLIVDTRGERFVNEHTRYNDFPKVFGNHDTRGPGLPNLGASWLIFDSTARSRIAVLSAAPGGPDPDWLHPSSDLDALAQRIGVDATALTATVAEYNDFAKHGMDPTFGRRALAPVDTAPYYALRLHPGTLTTTGGPRISSCGEVLRHEGVPIPGLFAAGTVAAGVFGHLYPSGGSPIAVAMTFGFLAGRSAAAASRRWGA